MSDDQENPFYYNAKRGISLDLLPCKGEIVKL